MILQGDEQGVWMIEFLGCGLVEDGNNRGGEWDGYG